MKLLIISSLLALAFGSNAVAVTKRELQASTQFHVYDADVETALLNQPPFTITYTHADQSLATLPTVKHIRIFPGACGPHGNPGVDATPDGVTLDSLVDTDDTTTTAVISVIPPGDGPWGPSETYVQHFCVWLGMGTPLGGGDGKSNEEVYGFFEVDIEATFIFDGTWTCIEFETQAYDPVCETTTTTVTAQAEYCGPSPLPPGLPVCIDVCVTEGSDPGYKINSITALELLTECDPECVKELGEGDNVMEYLQYIEFDSPPEKPGCRRVEFLMPMINFQSVGEAEDFGLIGAATFTLDERRQLGSGDHQPALMRELASSCSTFDPLGLLSAVGGQCPPPGANTACCGPQGGAAGNKVCKNPNACIATANACSSTNLDGDCLDGYACENGACVAVDVCDHAVRRLQEGTGDVAKIGNKITMTLAPEEASSASGVRAGAAAAAAALGAALLL